MTTNFGKRLPPKRPPPSPRRLRSGAVFVGAIGAMALSVAAASEWRDHRCRPRAPGDPDPRPAWCDSWGHSYYGNRSHSYGFSSGGGGGGSGIGHASFGGFGAHGSGHGGGS